MTTPHASQDRPGRWLAFTVAGQAASFLTYAIPEGVSIGLHPRTIGAHNLTFVLAMTLFGGLDIWLLLALALKLTATWSLGGERRWLLSGVLAGIAYLALAFAFSFSFGAPASDTPLVELVLRVILTPQVQARMLARHRVDGWGLYDPPLGWAFVLSPIVGCTVGGWLYGLLARRGVQSS